MQILDALSNSIDTPRDSSIIVLPSTNGFVIEEVQMKISLGFITC